MPRQPKLRKKTIFSTTYWFTERKQKADKVFLNSDRRPWSGSLLPKRFERVKEVAGVLDLGTIRDEITIYSFRDLWISEMLMAGNDVSTVARMAGTSIANRGA